MDKYAWNITEWIFISSFIFFCGIIVCDIVSNFRKYINNKWVGQDENCDPFETTNMVFYSIMDFKYAATTTVRNFVAINIFVIVTNFFAATVIGVALHCVNFAIIYAWKILVPIIIIVATIQKIEKARSDNAKRQEKALLGQDSNSPSI